MKFLMLLVAMVGAGCVNHGRQISVEDMRRARGGDSVLVKSLYPVTPNMPIGRRGVDWLKENGLSACVYYTMAYHGLVNSVIVVKADRDIVDVFKEVNRRDHISYWGKVRLIRRESSTHGSTSKGVANWEAASVLMEMIDEESAESLRGKWRILPGDVVLFGPYP